MKLVSDASLDVTGFPYRGLMTEAIRRAKERAAIKKMALELRLERAQARQDRGLGYLFYAARREANLTQGDLARRMGSAPATVCRWENGTRLPGLGALKQLADVTGLELFIGLRDPDGSAETFVVSGVLEDEGLMSYLVLEDDKWQRDLLPQRPWRAELDSKLSARSRLRR